MAKRKRATQADEVQNPAPVARDKFVKEPTAEPATEQAIKETLVSKDEPKKDFYLPFFINFMCSPGMKTAIAFLLAVSVVAFVAATCGVGGAVVASGLLVAGYATAGAGTGLLAGHLLCATGLFSKSNKVDGELPPTHIVSPTNP